MYSTATVPAALKPGLDAFQSDESFLSAESIRRVEEVRGRVEPHLRPAGWVVGERSRSRGGVSIKRSQGSAMRADAVHAGAHAALWIATGRSWTNNGYLEHLIEAVPCEGIDHLALAV